MTKQELIDFEKEVARRYEAGDIHAPCHLSGGNESQLIEIFQEIKREDFVLSTWRSHYHALLHGIPPDELMRQILAGKSMSINSVDPWFYSSSIAGGILPIAVGLGMAIKRKGKDRNVFCFVGDMVSRMGLFFESATYARNFELPVLFVIENNGKSVATNTNQAWGDSQDWMEYYEFYVREYDYELTWPHHGSGKFVNF